MESLADYLFDDDSTKRTGKQTAFFRLCGQAFVVRVMEEHLTCEIIQVHGIRALANASYMNGVNQDGVASVGGIRAILAGAHQFALERKVIGNAFIALINILPIAATANILVREIGGVPFLVGRMNAFRTDADVMKVACHMFEILSHFGHLRHHIVDAGALETLGYVFRHHKSHPEIQHVARESMKRLVG
jgi:hypothetical protein